MSARVVGKAKAGARRPPPRHYKKARTKNSTTNRISRASPNRAAVLLAFTRRFNMGYPQSKPEGPRACECLGSALVPTALYTAASFKSSPPATHPLGEPWTLRAPRTGLCVVVSHARSLTGLLSSSERRHPRLVAGHPENGGVWGEGQPRWGAR